MKQLKMIGLAAMAAMALVSAGAIGTASATTLEVGGISHLGSVTITATLKSGNSVIYRDTAGFSIKTCTSSTMSGSSTSPYTGATVTVPLSTLSHTCDRAVTAHKPGVLHIQHIAGTTNGTVTISGSESTTQTVFGTHNCVSGTGVHLGTLTGVKSGHATLDVNAVISCSGISSRWIGTYTITSPMGLGVIA